MLSVQPHSDLSSILATIKKIEVEDKCLPTDKHMFSCNHFVKIILESGEIIKTGLTAGHIRTLENDLPKDKIKLNVEHFNYKIAPELYDYIAVKICETGIFESVDILRYALNQPILKGEDLLEAARKEGLKELEMKNVEEAIKEGILIAPKIVLDHREWRFSMKRSELYCNTNRAFFKSFFISCGVKMNPVQAELPESHWLNEGKSENRTAI